MIILASVLKMPPSGKKSQGHCLALAQKKVAKKKNHFQKQIKNLQGIQKFCNDLEKYFVQDSLFFFCNYCIIYATKNHLIDYGMRLLQTYTKPTMDILMAFSEQMLMSKKPGRLQIPPQTSPTHSRPPGCSLPSQSRASC